MLSCGRLAKAFCLSCVVVFASCASVPKETAEMSAMLGRQLSVLKDTNGKMLERLYAEKEKNVARYVDEEWYPYWLERFFSNPVTESVWDEAVRTDSMEYRMEIVQALTKICMDEYKSYKDSLLSQIQAERDTVTALCEEQYDKARRVFAHCHTLERIIIYDRRVKTNQADKSSIFFDEFMTLGENSPRQSEVEKLYGEANDNDLCNILYTSGTTGESKGVMLTYGQYRAALDVNGRIIKPEKLTDETRRELLALNGDKTI